MNERRRFLQVLSGAVAALGANCSATVEHVDLGGGGNGGEGGTGGSGGIGGMGGNGGATSSSSSSSGMVCMPAGYNVGSTDTFTTDGLYQIAGTSFVLGRDAGGFYAMSSLCTHQQCNMNSKGAIIAGGIHCNCHGAEFDANGNVTKGPAVKALKHYQVTLECDGNLWVDTSVVVAADQRVAI